MAYNPLNNNGQATSANSQPVVLSAAQETILSDMKTALQVIDNFISGSKGLVTEDNSSSIKTAVEKIDDFISGSRGLVTEDNSLAIKTAVEAIQTAIQIMDDWDESDRAKVNSIVGVAGVSAGAGIVDTGTQRVTLASDDPVVLNTGIMRRLQEQQLLINYSALMEEIGATERYNSSRDFIEIR